MFPNIKIVEAIRKEYPAGTRVRLVKMDDIQAPPLGTEGTIDNSPMAEMRTIYNSARQSADSPSRWACFLLSNNKRRNNYVLHSV